MISRLINTGARDADAIRRANSKTVPWSIWLLFSTAASVALGFVAVMWADWVALALPFLVVLVGTLMLQSRMRLGVLSPLTVLLYSYLAVAISGPLVADAVISGLGVSASISLTPDVQRATYLVFIVAAGGVLAGAWLYTTLRPPVHAPLEPAHPRLNASRIRVIAAICSAIPLGLLLVDYGSGILFRYQYIPTADGDPIFSAAHTLALPAIAVLGWLTQASITQVGKLLSWIAIFIYAVTLFSQATREFALLPPLVALGVIAAKPNIRGRSIIVLGAAAGAIVMLQIPLTLRTSAIHGFLPYIQELPRALSALKLGGSLSNVLFAFQLTGYVGFVAAPLPLDTLLVSLDPRPGTLAGWYAVDAALRVNPATPYNAIGELTNHGWFVLAGFFFAVGAYFAHLEGRIAQLLTHGQGLAGLLLFALTAVFMVTTLQYNLRSSTRIVFYLLAFEVAIALALRIARREVPTSDPNGRPRVFEHRSHEAPQLDLK